MKLELVTPQTAGELDAFVEQHPQGYFTQTSPWGKVKEDWLWRGILCREETGRIRGAMAVLMRRVRWIGCRMLYAPRGPVADPEDLETLALLVRGAKEMGKVYQGYLLRIDPPAPESDGDFRRRMERLGFRIDPISDFSSFQPRLGYRLDLTGKTEEQLLVAFHRETGYNVKSAEQCGVHVEPGGPEDAEVFFSMMEHTARRDGFTPQSADFYRRLLLAFPQWARMYLAWYDGRPVAGTICLHMGSRTWELYSCSAGGEARHSNELLKWTVIRWALQNGSACCDFGGVEGYPNRDNPQFGLHRFLQGFGAEFYAYLGQMDLPLRPCLCRWVQWGQSAWPALRGKEFSK